MTSNWKTLVHPDEALLVLGSLNAHPQDRKIERSDVRPVQAIFHGEEASPVPFFDSWGKFGASSFAWHPEQPHILYFATDSGVDATNELLKIDLQEQRVTELPVAGLLDVHEMTVIGETLWLSNTASDELVAFDLLQERVSRRIGLSVQGTTPKITTHSTEPPNGKPEVVDRFHCNQVFEGTDGDLYALVHYAVGKQLVRRATQKLVKRQGNGGIINLTTGVATPLGLKQPHSVRKVDDCYWVLNSGRSTVNVYSPDWALLEAFPSRGWCRGGNVSQRLGLFYVGISEIRKRYLDLVPDSQLAPNMLQPISVETGVPVGEMRLSGLEQVNDVYVVSKWIAQSLLELQTSDIELIQPAV